MKPLTETVPADKYVPRRLLGECWSSYVGCSRFSVFWRVSRLNFLTSTEVHSMLGVRVGKHENAFEKLTHATTTLAGMGCISSSFEIDSDHWSLDHWWPFAGEIPWTRMPWRIRVCPACARSCYHSMLFQVPGLHSCPWHRIGLVDACPRCRHPFLNGLNDGNLLGVCRCGHDLVDYITTILGDSNVLAVKRDALDQYGAWARSSRSENYLLSSSSFDPFAWRALHTLGARTLNTPGKRINPPERPEELILEGVTAGRARKQTWCRFTYDISEDFYHQFALTLPSAWQKSLAQILTQSIAEVPWQELKEMTSDPRAHQTLRDLSTYTGLNHVHLPTQHIQRSTLQMLIDLNRIMRKRPFIMTHPMSEALVRRTVQRVLYRGYAAGVRAALAPQLLAGRIAKPTLCVRNEGTGDRGIVEKLTELRRIWDDHPPLKRARHPWVLLRLPRKGPASAEIAWTLQPA